MYIDFDFTVGRVMWILLVHNANIKKLEVEIKPYISDEIRGAVKAVQT